MSGTPLQNSPEELFPYFVFLGYEPFNTRAAFSKLMREAAVLGQGQRGLERLRSILAPVMLRRTKQSLIDGQPIVQLPGRCYFISLVESSSMFCHPSRGPKLCMPSKL